MINFAKVAVAHGIIKSIHYPWRLGEKFTRRSFGFRDHYYIMKMFRLFGRRYSVDTTWPNPLALTQQLQWRLDLCQNAQQCLFRARGTYERAWLKAVQVGLAHAERFLDIGANVGVFAVTVGQCCPEKKIIAVEALQDNYQLLQCNVERNGLKNVEPLWAAISAERGTVRFYINPIHDGGGSLLSFENYRTGDIALSADQYQKIHPDFRPFHDVPAHRIDDLVEEKTVIKVDVEGAEMQVLESGRAAFQHDMIDVAVVEVEHETINDVVQWFSQFHFDCFDIDNKTLLQRGDRLNHYVGNILCVRRGTDVYRECAIS